MQKSFKLSVCRIQAAEPPLCGHPQTPFRTFRYSVDTVIRNGGLVCGIVPIVGELAGFIIIPVQATGIGANPDSAVCRFIQPPDVIVADRPLL